MSQAKSEPRALSIPDTLQMLHDIRMSGHVPMFIVTDHPSDWPDFFVARLHVSGANEGVTSFAIMDRSIDRIRTTMEALGLVKLARAPEDPPVILETWI